MISHSPATIMCNEVSFETNQFELKDGSMLPEYEMSRCVSMKPGNVFYRLYRAAKYLSGYCSCYGASTLSNLRRLMQRSFIL